jgi:hypothetical protein
MSALCVPCVGQILPGPATVGIGTLSSASACLSSLGRGSRPCKAIPVLGLGGTVLKDAKVDVPFVRPDGECELVEYHVVDSECLPPHTRAIFGLPAIQQLDISVDSRLRDQKALMPAAIAKPAWNPFTVLLALFALAIASFLTSHVPTSSQPALLPGTAFGHPLFDSLPVDSGTFDTHPENWCSPRNQHHSFIPFTHFSDPPELEHVQCVQSAFTWGKGLTAIIDVDVFGTVSSTNISVGIDTLSDVNLAQREHLHDAQPINDEDVRGSGGVTSFNEQGDLHINVDGTVTKVPAFVASADRLPRRCSTDSAWHPWRRNHGR